MKKKLVDDAVGVIRSSDEQKEADKGGRIYPTEKRDNSGPGGIWGVCGWK